MDELMLSLVLEVRTKKVCPIVWVGGDIEEDELRADPLATRVAKP
jgi:hypothetical protein